MPPHAIIDLRMSPLAPPVSRFAPAPTGLLHLGHVANALYVWGVTQAAGGQVLLRVEDHDHQRSRRDYEDALIADLAWLGFEPAAAFGAGGAGDAAAASHRQSERFAIYASALGALRRAGRVYACECSRTGIARQSAAGERRYPGTCRDRGLAEIPGRGLRVRLDPTVEQFNDLRHGPQEQRPAEQCGDLLVRDRDGNWTYQFVATVDDWVQGVTLVIRGDDLLDSSGRQIQLARLLGRHEPPQFLHHPLVMKSPGQKLSKADNDTSVRDWRARGMTPEALIGEAAARVGLISRARPIAAADVRALPPLAGFAASLS
jgi:glutamyl/glutaminyl-tRNA synthetase